MPASAVDSDEYLIYPIPHSITYDGGSSLLRTTASVAGNTSVEDFLAAKGAFEEARAGLTAKPTPPTHTRGFLLDTNGDGVGDLVSLFGRSTDEPIVGDWDGDGTDTIGVKRGHLFLLTNSHGGGFADIEFSFGRGTDVPLSGDWDGDRTDTVGLRRGSEFYLKNSNTGGMADVTITMGTSGDTALVGDFNGDGVTDLAVHK